MHIHLPKPLHGWREFVGEVGIIVLGVVIALACEEAVSSLHQAESRREAYEAVRHELRQNLSYLKGRMATQDCIERRLDQIGDLLTKAGTGALSPRPQWVGQPSIWFSSDEAWLTATSTGRTNLFDSQQQQRFAAVYITSKRFVDAENREQEAWAQLRGLESWTGPLGEVGRAHFTAALQSARYELWETRVTMEEAFRRAKWAGLDGFDAKAQAEGFAIPHAICLPIDTPRDRALQILSRDSPPWGQPK